MSALRHDHDLDPSHDDDVMAQRPLLFEGSLAELGEMFRGGDSLTSMRSVHKDAEIDELENRPVALSPMPGLPAETGSADWTKTLTMVERAAATIKAYEKRFLQLEKQTRALADRAAEDQQRLRAHVQSLEDRLKQSEERITTAESSMRDAEYHEWEANMREKRAEQRAVEAETKGRQLEAYLRRVHELLSTVG